MHSDAGELLSNDVAIEDTFAEAFPMVAARVLITAESEKWAMNAARAATGFASSIIMSPAEAGVEGPIVPAEKSPDGRPGVRIQIYHRTRTELKLQMISRIGQCVLTCPTTAAFDDMPNAKRHLKVGAAIRMFGDGYEKKDTLGDRKVWRIPVMEGEFVVQNRFGVRRCVAGGNLIIMAASQQAGLRSAEEAVQAMNKLEGVVLPFPGGICRSGSKIGSVKYKLPASTNSPLCPTLRETVPGSLIPEEVKSVYELVFNGLTFNIVKQATAEGIRAATAVPGVRKITAANFGGKLGPYQISLKEALAMK
jgi:formylmethanofuran--tetrahydromethanopterin N-formyltransferase